MYEGTYWDLLGNLGELTEALNQMSVGPTVLEEPALQLPPSPSLPSWDSFKPVLQPQPPLPQVLRCAVLCCAASRCDALQVSASYAEWQDGLKLFCSVLYCAVLCCAVDSRSFDMVTPKLVAAVYIAEVNNTMQCNAMQCNAMQCNAMPCHAMPCNAMQCSSAIAMLWCSQMCVAHENICCLQLLDMPVHLPPFKPPKVANVEHQAPQLLPLPGLLEDKVRISASFILISHS